MAYILIHTQMQVPMPVEVEGQAPLLSIPTTVAKPGSVLATLETLALVSAKSCPLEFKKLHLLVTCRSP